MDAKTLNSYKWFRNRGDSAQAALRWARTESEMERRGWTLELEPDKYGHDCLGDHGYWCPEERKRLAAEAGRPVDDYRANSSRYRREAWCEHFIYVAMLLDTEGRAVETLGGIIDPDENFERFMAVELMGAVLAGERIEAQRAAECAAIMAL